jgi:hypothetical protein
VVQLTTRLTQAANAMKVPMEQVRQEVTSLLTGQITQDSTIAKRLGIDNAAVKEMQRNGTLVAEVMRRAEGYALAAEAQSNTVRGKLVNTIEVVVATLSRAFDPVIQKSKGALDAIFAFFATNGDRITAFVQRAVAGVESVVSAISKWIAENRSLVDEILAFGAVAGAAVAAYGLIAAAIAAITSPITLVIAGIVGLAFIWEKTRKYSEIEVGGRPIAAYVRATLEAVTSIWSANLTTQLGVMKAMFDAVVASVTTLAAAGRLIASVVQVPIRVFHALADTASETTQRVGKIFSPLASVIAPAVSRVVQLVVALGATFRSLVGAAEGPARRVGEVFMKLVDFVTAPLRQLLGLIAQLPEKLIAIVPGADAVRDAARDFLATLPGLAKPAVTLGETLGKVREEARETAGEIRSALETKEGLGSVADMVRSAWGDASEWLSAQLPELTTLGKKAGAALGLTAISTVAPLVDAQAAQRTQKALADLQRDKDAYFRFVADYRAEAEAAGDPLGAALRKIDADRAIALAKLEEQRKQLKDAISADVFEADKKAIGTSYDSRVDDARRKAAEGLQNDIAATLRLQRDLTIAAQRETEDRRIALIKDAGLRELRVRLAVNERWFEDESERIKASTADEIEAANQIDLLDEERKRRDERDLEEANRRMREATFGYAEYWQRLGDTVAAQWRTIGEVISDTILESRQLLASTVNGFLDDLTSGQTDLLKSLQGLSKGLTSLWTKALTDILMSGKNVAKQLQDLFASVHVKNPDGSTDFAGTALAGAGVGGMIGGLFAGPNNYAAEGGTIGGGIGAAIGAAIAGYFTGGLGAGAGAQIGAAIGTVLGTVIGSFVTKGTDSITVAVVDGVATVTEKGISAKARGELSVQVQRRVKEETKRWESLLDLFPEAIRDELKKLRRSINVTGGVEDADITDDGALDALAEFFSNDLPEAAFNAYGAAIRTGLGMLGVGSERLKELFVYWGTLQGKELHDAVERYVRVVLDTADIRGKIDAPIEEKLAAARGLSGLPPLQRLDDISTAIDDAVERMAGLTDIEDIIAAQEEINALSREYYQTQLQYLARIQQIQQSITTSIAQQREQIELAGKDDQGKVDFFFARMLELRGELENTTDPEKISRLVAQIQQYVSMALGIAPDSPEMRQKLLEILGDIDGIASTQLGKAIQEAADRDARPASALERAAELLLKAARDLADATDPPGDDDDDDEDEGDDGEDHGPPVDRPRPGGRVQPTGRSNLTSDDDSERTVVQLIERLAAMETARETDVRLSDTRAEQLIAAIREAQRSDAQTRPLTPEELARALRIALEGIELATADTIVVDNGDLGERIVQSAERRVITRIRNDPYSILPRAA